MGLCLFNFLYKINQLFNNITKDPIFLEDPKNENAKPYINIFAARTKDKDNPTLKKVIELYHSKEVTEAIKKETNDGSISVDLSLDELEKIVK